MGSPIRVDDNPFRNANWLDLVEAIEAWFLWRPRLRDPGDELVLEAAVNGRAAREGSEPPTSSDEVLDDLS